MSDADDTYTGETKPRRKWVAIVLTFLCPGLGYMYVGQFIKGLTINLLFLLMLEVFVLAFSVLKFFPILPFIVFAIGWLVFSALIASSVARRAADAGENYLLKGYNHWTMYAGATLLSFVVPLVLTVNFTTNHLWTLQEVDNAAMYPSIQPGDTVLVDLNAYRDQPPERGEVVAVDAPGEDKLRFLRIVGVHNDAIRLEGNTLYINDEAVDHSPLDDDQIVQADLGDDSDLLAWVEHNQGERYVISLSPRVYTELTTPPTGLAPDEYFVLADNRSEVPVDGARAEVRDSRHFDEISSERLAGVPRFVFWSRDTDGSIRWERIGIQLR